VWGCEALVKHDTPDKLKQRSVKCIFVGYPKETMGYYFYFPPENKIVIVRYVELFEKNLITQEASKRVVELKEIQDEDTSPSENISEHLVEAEKVEEHSLGDLNELTNYKAALLYLESAKWLDAMNTEMQSIEDNQVSLSNDAKMELMNLVLLSIPNDINNSVDACTLAKDMWKRVEYQLKPIVKELQFNFEFFKTLFQRDIKEMKDVFESTESELWELEMQYDFERFNLLEVSLKHEVELIHKTRFFKEPTLSKSLDTTYVVSKPMIDVRSTSKANDKVVQIVLWIVDSGCSKHMTGDRSLPKNFIEKFIGTVCFGNDNFAAITGYGIIYRAISLFIMHIMLKVLDIISLALDNFVMAI
ncbi:hypothetical protein Tco_0404201, partial [Tanacetum coccineum]